jgi:IS4 transposase
LHLLLDHDGYLPSFACISQGKVHEIRIARQMKFVPGTIVVFDRGYTDYAWFEMLDQQGVFWVTRMKDNANYVVIEKRPASGSIHSDQIICLLQQARQQKDLFFRRIVFWDEKQQRELAFLTNHLKFAASTIAAIYRERWQIELFFKALKQSCKIKSFVGTSPNAVKTQVWTALIAMLVLRYLQLKARFGWALANLVALLRQQLFVHRGLWDWLDQPFQPPAPLSEQQIPLILP